MHYSSELNDVFQRMRYMMHGAEEDILIIKAALEHAEKSQSEKLQELQRRIDQLESDRGWERDQTQWGR